MPPRKQEKKTCQDKTTKENGCLRKELLSKFRNKTIFRNKNKFPK